MVEKSGLFVRIILSTVRWRKEMRNILVGYTKTMTDAVVKEIYKDTLDIVRDGFQYNDFILTLGIIMRLCQLRQDLKGKGAEKKSIVMTVFKLFVTESGLLSDSEADTAGTFILTTLPNLIDTLKSISRDIADATIQAKKRFCCF